MENDKQGNAVFRRVVVANGLGVRQSFAGLFRSLLPDQARAPTLTSHNSLQRREVRLPLPVES